MKINLHQPLHSSHRVVSFTALTKPVNNHHQSHYCCRDKKKQVHLKSLCICCIWSNFCLAGDICLERIASQVISLKLNLWTREKCTFGNGRMCTCWGWQKMRTASETNHWWWCHEFQLTWDFFFLVLCCRIERMKWQENQLENHPSSSQWSNICTRYLVPNISAISILQPHPTYERGLHEFFFNCPTLGESCLGMIQKRAFFFSWSMPLCFTFITISPIIIAKTLKLIQMSGVKLMTGINRRHYVFLISVAL